MLARDFVFKALYAGNSGYFARADLDLILSASIPFTRLLGEWHYRRRLRALYASRNEAWMTPVEVFAPHYSRALASYMLRHARESALRVVEVGGGNGTNARCILDYLRDHAAQVYENTEYTLVEISSVLAERQRRELAEHTARVTLVNANFLQLDRRLARGPAFLLALEVLDNLPHDKVRMRRVGGHPQYEEAVCAQSDGSWKESFRPLADELIRRLLRVAGERVFERGNQECVLAIWQCWVGRRMEEVLTRAQRQLRRAGRG